MTASKYRGRQFCFWVLTLCLLAFVITSPTAAQEASANFADLASKALAARDTNDVPGAISFYQQALQLNPKWPDGWWFLGSLQYSSSDYMGARQALSRYLEITPNAAPALAIRGLCEFELGDYPASLADIQKALANGAANQSRNEKILRYHEALLLTRTGRFEDALRSYAFFASDAANPELLLAIGLAGLRTPLLPREVRADQQELYASAGKAAFDFMKGDTESARVDFHALFERRPPPPNAHYLYGYLLYATDTDSATVEFKAELEVDPANPDAEVMLAWIPVMKNDGVTGLPYARKALADGPASPSAQLVLGLALTETGDVNGGIEHLEKAAQEQPDNVEVHLALAKAYSKSGRKEDARRERLLCIEMTKNESPATHP